MCFNDKHKFKQLTRVGPSAGCFNSCESNGNHMMGFWLLFVKTAAIATTIRLSMMAASSSNFRASHSCCEGDGSGSRRRTLENMIGNQSGW